MKVNRPSLSTLGFLLLVSAFLIPDSTRAEAEAGTDPVRILFIGNSLTYYNELPKVLQKIVQNSKRDLTLEIGMVAEGGATLESHWFKGEARAAIKEGLWDYVVLQEQGSLGNSRVNGQSELNRPSLFHAYATLFDREIRLAGAQTVFFLTWGRESEPERLKQLTYAYLSIAKELDAIFVPAGIAWDVAINSPQKPDLLIDRGHPNFAGTYLLATVFANKLLGLAWSEVIDDSWCCVDATGTGQKVGSDDIPDTLKELFFKAAVEANTQGDTLMAGSLPPAPEYAALDVDAWLSAYQEPETSQDEAVSLQGTWVGELELTPSISGLLTLSVSADNQVQLEYQNPERLSYKVRPLFWQASPQEWRMYDEHTHILYRMRRSSEGVVGVAERLFQEHAYSIVSTFSLDPVRGQ